MIIPEQLQNIFERYLRRVILYLDGLGVITNAAVGWVLSAAAGVANPGAVYPFRLPEPGISAPKSAHGQSSCF